MTENNLVRRDRRAILLWLLLCASLVAGMVAIGGYTRLSGSGLSIVAWKPVHGTLPPLNPAQWQEEFAAYKTSPQYQQVNKGMSLEEFKVIYWPEYIHRLLGRAIGLIFVLPLAAFICRRSFARGMGWRLLGIFALGGVQGAIGWIMVASGLVEDPHVNPIKLALHLMTALAIYALIVWTLLDVASGTKPTTPRSKAAWGFAVWCVGLVLQITLGALVAGLHAGLIYNTWPSMNGMVIPPDIADPVVLAQFCHRNLAVLLVLGFLFWWKCCPAYARDKTLVNLRSGMAAVILGQFCLGVVTLLNAAPLDLAWAHQLTALLLFTLALNVLHRLIRQ